jgi:hypothetical protein
MCENPATLAATLLFRAFSSILLKSSTPQSSTTNMRSAPRFICIVLCAIGAGILFLLIHNGFPLRSAKYFGDSTLVATKPPDQTMRFAPTYGPRFLMPLWRVYYHFKPPPKGTTSFPASEVRRCSIHGLLIQCDEVSGIQFLIDKNIACGTVQFGSSNVLSGPQWVNAFTNAVRTGIVEWWDPKKGRFRKENPVFIRADQNSVLVLPPERVNDFLGSH